MVSADYYGTDECWNWGIYFNKRDDRLWVRKRVSVCVIRAHGQTQMTKSQSCECTAILAG